MTVVALCELYCCQCPPAESYAFVVGIDAYTNMRGLQGSKNDVESVHDLLRSRGFTVFLLKDVSRRRMLIAFELMANMVRDGDVVVVYFSGHGFMLNGNMHLCPRDARSGTSWLPGMDCGGALCCKHCTLAGTGTCLTLSCAVYRGFLPRRR